MMRGAGKSYLPAYALFLKATGGETGLLATPPAFLGSFAQLLATWFAERLGQRRSLIIAGLTAQSLLRLPIIALPILFPTHVIIILMVSHLLLPSQSLREPPLA